LPFTIPAGPFTISAESVHKSFETFGYRGYRHRTRDPAPPGTGHKNEGEWRMKKMRTIWITALVAVSVLAVAGVAGAATKAKKPAKTPTAPAAGAGANCVTTNPGAVAELQALRTEWFEVRQAWFDKYGTDRFSDEARAALQQLRDDHIAKVQAVFDKYGIDATAGSRAGAKRRGRGMGRCGGMRMGIGRGMGGGMGQCVAPATAN
jgi:uncharacterized membrane protein